MNGGIEVKNLSAFGFAFGSEEEEEEE